MTAQYRQDSQEEVSHHGGAFLMGLGHLTPPAFYDMVAARYDANYTSPSDRAEDRVLYDWLGPVDGLDVIDVGCGTGALLEHAAGQPRCYVGIDASQRMLEIARRKCPRERFILGGDGTFTPQAESADLTVAMWSLSYLAPGALGRMHNALRPGGRLFAVAYTPRYVHRPAFACNGVTHQARTWTPDALYVDAVAAGFTDVRVRGFRFVEGDSKLPVGMRAVGIRTASRLLPSSLALALILTGRKPQR